MTPEQIEALAREAALTDRDLGPWVTDYGDARDAIINFAAAVRDMALEEAAKACEGTRAKDAFHWELGTACAAAIRALKTHLESRKGEE